MNTTTLKAGRIYYLPMSDIEYIGYFYGNKGNESIKNAYIRIKEERGHAPDFLMNAELFDFSTRKAASDVISDGVIHRLTEGYGIAFPDNKKAVFSYKNNVGAKDYIGAYPVLVRNRKAENINPIGITGRRGRTALGIAGDALLVALIPDNGGVTLAELRNALISSGADNAINLDGGGSTQFYSPLGNHFSARKVRGFIGIWIKNSPSTQATQHKTDVRTVKVRTNLRIRKTASLLGSVVGRLYNGDKVTVLETKGNWCKISAGWVSASYLVK